MGGPLQEIRARFSVARFARATMEAAGHPPLMQDGDDGAGSGVRTVEVGVDPIRVLLFGDSAAVGWGVPTREEAMDRPLARELAAATGRGVVVENRGVPHVRMSESVDSLGAAGTHTFHVAIWFPSIVECIERLSIRSWRRQLEHLLDRMGEESDVPLVIGCVPVPQGASFLVAAGRPWALAVNRTIRQAAAARPGVASSEAMPLVARGFAPPTADAALYRQGATLLAAAVLEHLGLEDRRVGALAQRSA